MNKNKFLGNLLIIITLAPAIIFLGRLILPDLGVFSGFLNYKNMVGGAAVAKMIMLLGGGLLALQNSLWFERNNPVRPAWLLLSLGLLASFAGQLGMAPYQIFGTGEAPFPGVSDIYFLLGYPLFFAGLLSFMKAYKEAGYPFGSTGILWAFTIILAVLCLVIGFFILRPIAHASKPALEIALNISYPILDFIILIPAILLVRLTLPLRLGQVGQAWLVLLGGFIFMSAGDIVYAYTSSLEIKRLDPLIHIMYLISYCMIGLGVLRQNKMLDQ